MGNNIFILAAFFLYLIIMIVIGARCSANTKNTEDFYLGGRRLVTVMGMFADKDYVSCVHEIASRSAVFIASSSGQPRSQEASALAELAKRDCAEVHERARIEDAVDLALSLAGKDDVILVCGSIYNISPARSRIEAFFAE